MKEIRTNYHRHRIPPVVISHAVSLYYRFTLSLQNIEDLLAERGVIVSFESNSHRQTAQLGRGSAPAERRALRRPQCKQSLRSIAWAHA